MSEIAGPEADAERSAAEIDVTGLDRDRLYSLLTSLVVPPVELATIVHPGPHTGIDRAYGSLATYVTEHVLAVDGPIREYYLVGRRDTAEAAEWRTEIGWPIFHTGPAPGGA